MTSTFFKIRKLPILPRFFFRSWPTWLPSAESPFATAGEGTETERKILSRNEKFLPVVAKLPFPQKANAPKGTKNYFPERKNISRHEKLLPVVAKLPFPQKANAPKRNEKFCPGTKKIVPTVADLPFPEKRNRPNRNEKFVPGTKKKLPLRNKNHDFGGRPPASNGNNAQSACQPRTP